MSSDRCTGISKTTKKRCRFEGVYVKYPRPGGNPDELERCRHHRDQTIENDKATAGHNGPARRTKSTSIDDESILELSQENPSLPGPRAGVAPGSRSSTPLQKSANVPRRSHPALSTPDPPRKRYSSRRSTSSKQGESAPAFEDKLLGMPRAAENKLFGKSLAKARVRQLQEAKEPHRRLNQMMNSEGDIGTVGDKMNTLVGAAVSMYQRINLDEAATRILAERVDELNDVVVEQAEQIEELRNMLARAGLEDW